MEKKIRLLLYAVSLIIVLAVLTLLLFSGRAGKSTDAMTDAAGEPQASEADGQALGTEREEVSATDGQTESEAVQESIIIEDTENTGESETQNDSTTLVFAGDVLFAYGFCERYDAGGIENIIAPELLAELTEADICMVNNEFPFSTRGTPAEDKQYTFRCDPSYVTALSDMGVDIVTLANNHTLDYGREALSDTFTALDGAGVLYAGAGETAERAYELQVIEKSGKKFGFLAASRVIPVADWKVENKAPGMLTAYDDTKLVELIAAAKEQCDFLSVYLHWGIERDEYPQDYQTKIAADCVEAGADVIIGAHPHCLQGITYIDGKPVFYSLGNFVFGQTIDRTAVLKVTVSADGEAVCRILPAYAAGGQTALMDEAGASETYRYLTSISTGAKVGADGAVSESN